MLLGQVNGLPSLEMSFFSSLRNSYLPSSIMLLNFLLSSVCKAKEMGRDENWGDNGRDFVFVRGGGGNLNFFPRISYSPFL